MGIEEIVDLKESTELLTDGTFTRPSPSLSSHPIAHTAVTITKMQNR